DLAGEGESMDTKADVDPIVSRDMVTTLGSLYLNGAHPKHTPLASPLFAGDFTGLPPTQIFVGTAECLLDDALRLEKKLRGAGTEAELIVAEDMIHVWPIFCSFLPEAQHAVEQAAGFMGKHY
ncbi:MAG: alpha/beta hydrolase, partial [Salinisphaera sp.]|nr:alpha/beta hydrolase [Salinisphaera sp.]